MAVICSFPVASCSICHARERSQQQRRFVHDNCKLEMHCCVMLSLPHTREITTTKTIRNKKEKNFKRKRMTLRGVTQLEVSEFLIHYTSLLSTPLQHLLIHGSRSHQDTAKHQRFRRERSHRPCHICRILALSEAYLTSRRLSLLQH